MSAPEPSPRLSPFEGELVRLRALTEVDAELLNPLFCDSDVLEGLQISFPQAIEGYLDFYRRQREDPASQNFVIERLSDGQAMGGCGLLDIFDRASSAGVGIWIGRPYWGQGFGTDATRTLCRFGFREMNLHRIYLHVYATNPKAVRAYEKVGFVIEGTLREDIFVGGRFANAHIMGLLESEFEG